MSNSEIELGRQSQIPADDQQIPLSTLNSKEFDNVVDLVRVILCSDIHTKDKLKLIDEVRKITPASDDRWSYRICVYGLCLCVNASIIVIGVLSFNNQGAEIPETLIALGSAAVGALATMMSNSNRQA